MRSRYRFYACTEGPCPKLSTVAGSHCVVHPEVEMVEVILRREKPVAPAEQMKQTADKLKAAADKVGEAGRIPNPDPFGLGDMFEQMGKDMKAGRRRYTDAELDEEDEDEEDEL